MEFKVSRSISISTLRFNLKFGLFCGFLKLWNDGSSGFLSIVLLVRINYHLVFRSLERINFFFSELLILVTAILLGQTKFFLRVKYNSAVLRYNLLYEIKLSQVVENLKLLTSKPCNTKVMSIFSASMAVILQHLTF